MTDLGWLVVWLAVLSIGIGGCLLLAQLGVRTTYVRDLLHVGTGVWVLGWPEWRGSVAPVLLPFVALLVVSLVPRLHNRWARAFVSSVSDADERFDGLVGYTGSYAALTLAAFWLGPFPAAAGLLALSLGDGVGGAIGRRFGKHHFRVPGAKEKSLEGSLAVLVAAALGVLIASARFGVHVGVVGVVLLGASAAIAEALSPKSSDNVVVPAVVWGLTRVLL